MQDQVQKNEKAKPLIEEEEALLEALGYVHSFSFFHDVSLSLSLYLPSATQIILRKEKIKISSY